MKMHFSVLPVKTGIKSFQKVCGFRLPACEGITTFYEIINFDEFVKVHLRRCAASFVVDCRSDPLGFPYNQICVPLRRTYEALYVIAHAKQANQLS